MSKNSVEIKPGEHVFVSGVSGSGKTTLLNNIIKTLSHEKIIIIDPMIEFKGDIEADENSLMEELPYFLSKEAKNKKILVIRIAEQDFFEYFAHLIIKINFKHRINIAIVVDEAWLFNSPTSIPQQTKTLWLTGRHYNFSLIAATQRAANVNVILRDMAKHIFVGRFRDPRDKQFYTAAFGDITSPTEKYSFEYFKELDNVGLFTSKLELVTNK